MDKLGKILATVVARQPRSATFIEARLRLALAAVLGEDLASGCHGLEIRSGTIWIKTSNRALAHQLRSDSEQLIRRLSEETYMPRRVRRVRVQIDSHPAPPPRGGREG